MYYCCTTDVVTRKLSVPQIVRYSSERKRLLTIMEGDQKERSSEDFFSTDKQVARAITKREKYRTEAVLDILAKIRSPSVRNIGLDGSRAVWLIALHNFQYKQAGKLVLAKMRRLYYENREDVFYPGIPYLVDRIMVAVEQPIDPEHLPYQLYGTQGFSFVAENGDNITMPFPIKDSKRLRERRKKFGLRPVASCIHQQ